MSADLRDEHGNPIQLTDEHGCPVQLTDEYGRPLHITGVAKPASFGTGAGGQQKLHRSGSSSSSSSEDDGQGGRRKRKGLKEKIKEKLTGGKHKDYQEEQEQEGSATGPTALGSYYTTPGEQHQDEHEKKSILEKIKEKLPGHHNE